MTQIGFIIACLLLSLEYLHCNGIIHRDVKPENMVFDCDGYVRLTDLGISKILEGGKPVIDSSGTPGYMAPEVMTNIRHSCPADFYAVGVILHEFIVGRRPFKGKNRREIKENMFAKEVSIKETSEGWGNEAVDLCLRLLRRKPVERIGAKGGCQEIKSHPFFKEIDWEKLYAKKIASPIRIQVHF